MTQEPTMLEKVAEALRAAGGLHNPDDAETLARAALTALMEPTSAMQCAAVDTTGKNLRLEQIEGRMVSFKRQWKAALQAALTEGE